MSLYSLEIEKYIIQGLFKFPDIYYDISGIIDKEDFYMRNHQILFSVIKSAFDANDPIDKVMIAQSARNLGINFKELTVFDYLESLELIQVNKKGILKGVDELHKLTIRRKIIETANNLVEEMQNTGSKDINEIIALADSTFSNNTLLSNKEEEPINVYEKMWEAAEEKAKNPVEEQGYSTPYPLFNEYYGGLQPGNIYAFVARPGEGKSTFLMDICDKTANASKIPALILDTEMESEIAYFRKLSAITGVPYWYIVTGQYAVNEEMKKRIIDSKATHKDFKLYHKFVVGKPMDQVKSMIRKWYYQKVGRGNPAIVCYDYLKLTGEKVNEGWKEYQAIGEKINILKDLSSELQIPILTACQLNRTGDGRARADDSTAIAQSDRLYWFVSFLGIFRKKTNDEILSEGKENGTHKLIPLKGRFQGKNAPGANDYIEVIDNKGKKDYMSNYINFEVENFNVTEKSSLRSLTEDRKRIYRPRVITEEAALL